MSKAVGDVAGNKVDSYFKMNNITFSKEGNNPAVGYEDNGSYKFLNGDRNETLDVYPLMINNFRARVQNQITSQIEANQGRGHSGTRSFFVAPGIKNNKAVNPITVPSNNPQLFVFKIQ